MKVCTKCKVKKPLIDFYRCKKHKDGLKYECKECQKKINKAYEQENKEKLKITRKKYKANHKQKYSNKTKNKKYAIKHKLNSGNKERVPKIKVFTCYTDMQGHHYIFCSKCKKFKLKSEFSLNKSRKLGVQKYCKKCFNEYRKGRSYKYRTYRKNEGNKYSEHKKLYNKSKAMYDRKAVESISWHDYTERNAEGFLLVKCRYCGRKFVPKNRELDNRAYVLNKLGVDSIGFYCSSGCKKSCPTYNRTESYGKNKTEGTSREVQPELRQLCLLRDGYTCQKCNAKGKTVQLHCHHIYPLNESPITSADVDDTVTLCKSCHKEAHKIAGCGYYELRCQKNT